MLVAVTEREQGGEGIREFVAQWIIEQSQRCSHVTTTIRRRIELLFAQDLTHEMVSKALEAAESIEFRRPEFGRIVWTLIEKRLCFPLDRNCVDVLTNDVSPK